MAKISAEEKEETRQRILIASRKVFRASGYDKTQIKQIAMEAGVGTSTIYGYYPSKVELFVSAFIDELLLLKFDEATVREALKEGLIEGLMQLLFYSRIGRLEVDKGLLKSFIAASFYDTRENICEAKFHNIQLEYEYIKNVLEIYERTHLRLCAFSLNHLAAALTTIVEHLGIHYMVGELTLEQTEEMMRNQTRVLFAGKYADL